MPDEPNEISGWPTAANLTTFLGTFGITISDDLDLQGAIDSAIDSFERGTSYFPFIADPAGDEVRYYDGPSSNILDLQSGIVSFTSLTIMGTPYVSDQPVDAGKAAQFWLKPMNAAARRRPYTYIDFGPTYPNFINYFDGSFSGYIGYVPGAPKCIAITATFGYCRSTNVPSQAYSAVLRQAAMELAPQIALSVSGGVLEWRNDVMAERYAGVGNTGPLSQQIELWEKAFLRAVATFKRIQM